MPLLSEIARRKKVAHFFANVPTTARILEVGCADKWLGRELGNRGFNQYTGFDLYLGADIVGNIKDWKKAGLRKSSFDVIAAFELVEHVDCFSEMFSLLRPGGLLFLTSPVPHMDWACKTLEFLRLNQRRTSPHDHLIEFSRVPLFEPVSLRTVGLMAQWGTFRKPVN
jgi:hypothetical protein